MLALIICVVTGFLVWLWLAWDMTREVRAGWSRGEGIKAGFKGGLRMAKLKPRAKPPAKPPRTGPEPEPEPPPKPVRDPRDWMSE